MAIARHQQLKELEPGLHALFGLTYSTYEGEDEGLFDQQTSDRAFEEEVMLYGFGAAATKLEGGSVQFDEAGEAWTSRYTHETVALAFAITEEAMEDNLYDRLATRYTKALARSMYWTRQVKAASVYNNAFNSSFVGGDGVALCSTAHPLTYGGTFSNRPTTGVDLSEQALEDASIAIQGFVDERGIPAAIKIQRLIIPKELVYVAKRILGSDGRVGTSDNDLNALKTLGVVPSVKVNHYLTDTNAWFLKTDTDDGLKCFNRVRMQTKMDGDWDTGNVKYKARERYSYGWSDPRGIYGSPGST